jgi:hypothetical protein
LAEPQCRQRPLCEVLQIVANANWCVFDGCHSIPLSAGGVLIAGASALPHREEVKTFALCEVLDDDRQPGQVELLSHPARCGA